MLDHILYKVLYHLSLIAFALLGLLFLLFAFLFVLSSFKASKEHASVPACLPWMGRQEQLLASIRANFRGLGNSVKLFTEGYGQVS